MPLDFLRLRHFLEAARELSFRRAARNLRLSAPAITRSIALLERSAGKKLFIRGKRRATLTGAGESLKSPAERIFDQIEQAELDLKGDAPEAAIVLRLAGREMTTNYLLPGPLARISRRFPNARFAIHELPTASWVEALKKDQVDLGFYYKAIPDPALEAVRLGRTRFRIYGSRALWPRGARPASLAAVLRLPFVVPRPLNADPEAPNLDGFPDNRHRRIIRYESESLETNRKFILKGLAVGILPELAVSPEDEKSGLARLPGPSVERDLYVFKRRGRPLPAAAQALIEEAALEAKGKSGAS